MEKWEYLFAEYERLSPLFVYRVEGVKLPKDSRYERVVRLLGEDGWELAAIASSIIFKRPWTGQPYDVQSLINRLEATRR